MYSLCAIVKNFIYDSCHSRFRYHYHYLKLRLHNVELSNTILEVLKFESVGRKVISIFYIISIDVNSLRNDYMISSTKKKIKRIPWI